MRMVNSVIISSFFYANLEAPGKKFIKKYIQHKGKLIIKKAFSFIFTIDAERFFITVAHVEFSMTYYLVEAARY